VEQVGKSEAVSHPLPSAGQLTGPLSKIPYKWVVATVFVLALFIDILDLTAVNVSLVSMSSAFDASVASTTWVVLGYSLSLAVWIPVSGWVGDRFGTKNTFMFALTVFITASLLCSEARSINMLIASRFAQGVGGGLLTPVGTTLLFRAFPPEERARASSILSIPTVAAPALGPVLGGYLTDNFGWRWIFRINLPIGIIALLIAWIGLHDERTPGKQTFDLVGFLLAATGFPAAVYALERGAEEGWGSTRIVGLIGFAAVTLTALIVWSFRAKAPMLALGLLRERLFRTTNVVSFVSTMSFLGLVFLLPQFLQRVAGHTASEAGLATFPQAIGAMIMSRFAGRLYPKLGPRRMLMIAYLGMAVFTAYFLRLSVSMSDWEIRTIMFCRGFCLSMSFIPLQAASYARISPADTGRASAIYSTQRQLGNATGVAVMSTVLLSTIPAAFPRGLSKIPVEQVGGFTSAFRWAIAVTIGLILVAAALSSRIHDSDAAGTIRKT
jgi:EmrB/QacA subfamily drug resistance transporter